MFFDGDYIEGPLVPLTSTLRPGFSSLRLSVSLCVRGGSPPIPGQSRSASLPRRGGGTEVITSPTPCAVMLVLPLPHRFCAAIQHML